MMLYNNRLTVNQIINVIIIICEKFENILLAKVLYSAGATSSNQKHKRLITSRENVTPFVEDLSGLI